MEGSEFKLVSTINALRFRNDSGEGDFMLTIIILNNNLNIVLTESAYEPDAKAFYLTKKQIKEKYNIEL